MTTIITIIIAVVLLVALGKIFFNGSSRPKKGTSANKPFAASEKEKKNQPDDNKGLGTSSEIKVKGANLFNPPPEPTLFTGRKDTQKKIMARATTSPVVIGISGCSGVGKTCLAITLIKIYSPQFSNNCLFIDMQGDSPTSPSAEDIMRRIILRFHPSQPLPTDSKKLTKLYRVALKAHKGILILDNASGAKQVKSLAPPSSWLMIVTSIKPALIPNMVAIELEPMDSLEAQTLLTRWAPKISPTIKEIAFVCKGLPMALEIIGKLFAINATMAPEYFTKKLIEVRKGFGEEEEGKTDFVAAIRSAFILSFAMLPNQAAGVLKKLAVFPGSFTAKAVSFICEDFKSLSLTGLEKYGLVQYNINTNRFYLHQQIKNFIKPLLTPGDRNMTERRLATEFMNVLENAHLHVEKGGSEAIKGFRLFDLELDNIKAGMEWGRKYCDKDKDAAQICSAYTEFGATMISQRLSPAECIQWFEAALTAARQLNDKESERKHLLNLGAQYVLLKKPLEATNTLLKALSFCKKEGDIEGQKVSLNHLTQLSLSSNDQPLAVKYLEEHIELIQADGNKEEEFKLLTQLTKSCTLIKEYNKAILTGEEAMELAALSDDKFLHTTLFHNLGVSYMSVGETEKALKTLESALGHCRSIPNSPLQWELIRLISEVAFKARDVPRTLKVLLNGLNIARKSKDLPNEGALLIQLVEIHIQNQSADQAMGYMEEALDVSKKIKDRAMEGMVLWTWGQALEATGDLAGAVSRGLEALKIYEELKIPETSELRAQVEKWSGN